MQVDKSIFQYLENLKQNNNRDWFTDQKPRFVEVQKSVKEFYGKVGENLEIHDVIDNFKLFRIYRDVRFSKDKTPYKTHFSGSFSRKGSHLRGGYYLQIESENSFLAGGFWQPNKEDLLRIRKEIELDASEFREILENPEFVKNFGTKFEGDEVKTVPRGFDKNHPDIDLLRKKGFIAVRNFSDKQVFSNNFLSEIDTSYKALRPFFNLMSEVLTTNLNGESLL
ncbi:DUF2461 domain-containing protein [Tenacibaculum finnmarkense genomovar finnmarkense]|uniref:DUF2461 domain-containing protein n=1 Tax=Tenacibaculum finnmarkense TaxID=2781243 RepID=UPI001E2D20F8|nr:DUF2461 domain-containing protein [Tenacibaculum finnmarkense]MCD8416901.1 DUF2461 domain-containing protein [Tenacibaculum finnmarkense genomovar finnmarkense]MCG8185460.1 DUF2461 domain-containing protein [Tenacibaculum finnmarkense genomovar finnmarkense]MCG8201844.1 DUF2461 domain-containing protein [Tenacibaculum finnmarkense genomovar finnmarkense]MCG8209407.1 DUF2461 domain-containing protein [Tenacibaculum finnmarkense genomovar finnmarkense]MCG8212203.1 DUF2461 domain-containing pr